MINPVDSVAPKDTKPFDDLKIALERKLANRSAEESIEKVFNENKKETKPEDVKSKNVSEKDEKSADQTELNNLVKDILGYDDVDIEFSIDEDTKKMIMKVIDTNTKEVVQQVPSEVTMKIAKMISQILGNGAVTNKIV